MRREEQPTVQLSLRCSCGAVGRFLGPADIVYGWACRAGWTSASGGWECPGCRYAYERSFEAIVDEGRRGLFAGDERDPFGDGVIVLTEVEE